MARRKKKTTKNPILGTSATIELKMVMDENAQQQLRAENGALRLVIHQMAQELEQLRVELAVHRALTATGPQVWTHKRG